MSLVSSGQELVPVDESAEKKFNYAFRFVERGAWVEAAKHFEQLAFRTKSHHRSTASWVMAARCRLNSGESEQSIRLADAFFLRFPRSSYRAEMRIIQGEANMAQHRAADAVESFLYAVMLDKTKRQLVTDNITESLALLSNNERRQLVDNLLRRDVPLALLLEFGLFPGTHKHIPSAQGSISIAALLPSKTVHHGSTQIVREMLEGMLTAIDVFQASRERIVELRLIEASRADSIEIFVHEQIADTSVKALLCGVFSSEARIGAAAAAGSDLLCIIPAATEEGLHLLGENIFQMNIPLADRASLLADYSMLEIDANNVGILRHSDVVAAKMADAFAERWKRLGKSGALVFDWECDRDIESALLEYERSDGAKIDLLFAPAMSLRDISNILSGIAATGCSAIVLGCGDWYYPSILRKYRKQVVIFESDSWYELSDPQMLTARDAYVARSGRSFSKHAMFGYDACMLALECAVSSNGRRSAMLRNMHDVFQGVRSVIDFTTGGRNACLMLFRSEAGEIKQLESFFSK